MKLIDANRGKRANAGVGRLPANVGVTQGRKHDIATVKLSAIARKAVVAHRNPMMKKMIVAHLADPKKPADCKKRASENALLFDLRPCART